MNKTAASSTLIMLTGDSRMAAEAIARSRYRALPEDKVIVMDGLVTKYGSVAMVGDRVRRTGRDATELGHRHRRSRIAGIETGIWN